MPASEEMKSALADVRRAYRLIWSYQRRILDIVALVAGEFEEHEFYGWETYPRDRPCGRWKDPTGKWAWDLLPLHQASFLYLPPDADRNRPAAGQWMLEIVVKADDGFEDPETGDEPDASDFTDATSTSSKISMYGWLCTASCERHWLNGVWHHGEWPDEDGAPVEHSTPPFKIVGQSFDLAELADESAVKDAVAKFKETLGTTLGIGAE